MTFLITSPHTANTHIHPLSLHDALPISGHSDRLVGAAGRLHRIHGRLQRCAIVAERNDLPEFRRGGAAAILEDRKSTRLNSSHGYISYAVFCLKKKKECICSKLNFLIV